jgi:hypothetical protein
MSKSPLPRPYRPSRAELEQIESDFRRAAVCCARAESYATCEAYFDLADRTREQIDCRDAAELDLDIPISVEELDVALFASSSPATLRSHM